MPLRFNPTTGELDLVNTSSGGTASIPEYSTDPGSPSAQDAWVLKTTTGGGSAGAPLGLLLALTDAGASGSSTYQFSYYTNEGTIIRTTLS